MKFVQIVATEAVRASGLPRAGQLLALDSRGRIWERFTDQPEGEWSIVPGPANRPQRSRQNARKL